VALVGHTDALGSLAGNTDLSRARAVSVRERLIAEYAVPAAQLTAEGVGYLAPRATNQTEDGRARNRRVEAIVTSTR
jgi:OOP family OmpA-OmpF porin